MGDLEGSATEASPEHTSSLAELSAAGSSLSDTKAATTTSNGSMWRRPCWSCGWYQFQDDVTAKAYCTLGMGRGAVVMSNIFLSTSFLFLASQEAGCLERNADGDQVVVDECPFSVHGMAPSALITNIAVFSGVLSACFMPVTGAIVDYTAHRKRVGVVMALLILLIQVAQIGTVAATWFPMAILQGIAGFLYQVQVLAVYAYLPDIARNVGEATMTNFQSTFTMTQFGSQALFLAVIIALGMFLALDDVQLGQVGQGVNVVWSGLFFVRGWWLMPKVPAANVLPEGQTSLFVQSFKQVGQTIQHVRTHYRSSLGWFLVAVIFAEAATNAFTVVSVVYLSDEIGLTGTEIGIFFFITLIGTLPGSLLGAFVTRKTNPNTSWRLCLLSLCGVAIVGALLLGEGMFHESLVWGAIVGVMLGWHYPTEGLCFSMLLPKGQEAELSGFYVYCTQILGWLPPLVFSAMVEANISQAYGILAVCAFFVMAVVSLSFMAPWPDCVLQIQTPITVAFVRVAL